LLVAGLNDLSVTVAWFAVAAVIGAFVWWQITPLASFTRTATAGEMDESQLVRQVSADGWFFVVAAVGGLVSGIGLSWWRRRDLLLMVVLVALGGFLATWVMLTAGQAFGPPNTDRALANAAVGAQVPMQLGIQTHGLWFVWTISALVGAIGVIWGTDQSATTGRDPGAPV
jgi:hypothetical protein